MKIVHFKNLPIFQQLQLEEALLRADKGNWCLINEGSPPAIVMGISGKIEELVDTEKAQAAKIPVIKRFSGGGTVVVDEETIFVTYIFQKDFHPFAAYPEPILRWSEEIYRAFFPALTLRENDYVIGEKKCGGNAQYIKKDRWLHHTTFLWDYSPEKMGLLLHPKKAPAYRQGRLHEEFLTRLSAHAAYKTAWIEGLKQQLKQRYSAQETTLKTIPSFEEESRITCLLS